MSRNYIILYILSAMIFYAGCAPSPRFRDDTSGRYSHVSGKQPKKFKVGQRWRGTASYYAEKFHGRKTANGEVFDMNGVSAAHRTLPFGTILKVTNLKNGRSIKVRINDRGPYKGKRILDLSLGAAKKIDMIQDGVIKVELEIMSLGDG